MEQPRVQIQNESSSELINGILICHNCEKAITASGECECHEFLLIPNAGDQNMMEFYRRYFISLVKHFIQTGVPNLSLNSDGNVAKGALETYYYAANGLKAEFGPYEVDLEETQNHGEFSFSRSNLYPADAAADSVSERLDEETLISNPCEEKIEGNQENSNYLQLRLTTLTFRSGKSTVILDILGQHLDWHQILQHLESDTLDLRWRLYHIDAIFVGYYRTDSGEIHAAYDVEDDHFFNSNAEEEYDGMIIFYGYHNNIHEDDYLFNSNAEEEYDCTNNFDNIDYYSEIHEDDYGFDEGEYIQNIFEYDDGFNRGPPPAAKSAVESLQTHIICRDSEVAFCSICIDKIGIGNEAKTLPCNHFYHSECIIKWLRQINSCPQCRHELPSHVDEDHRQG